MLGSVGLVGHIYGLFFRVYVEAYLILYFLTQFPKLENYGHRFFVRIKKLVGHINRGLCLKLTASFLSKPVLLIRKNTHKYEEITELYFFFGISRISMAH